MADSSNAAPRAPSASSIQGILELTATLGSSGTVRNSIRSPARERMTVGEPSGVHFIEIEVSGIAAFESLLPTKPKCLL
jgi:hypothetical protein